MVLDQANLEQMDSGAVSAKDISKFMEFLEHHQYQQPLLRNVNPMWGPGVQPPQAPPRSRIVLELLHCSETRVLCRTTTGSNWRARVCAAWSNSAACPYSRTSDDWHRAKLPCKYFRSVHTRSRMAKGTYIIYFQYLLSSSRQHLFSIVYLVLPYMLENNIFICYDFQPKMVKKKNNGYRRKDQCTPEQDVVRQKKLRDAASRYGEIGKRIKRPVALVPEEWLPPQAKPTQNELLETLMEYIIFLKASDAGHLTMERDQAICGNEKLQVMNKGKFHLAVCWHHMTPRLYFI